MKYVLRLILLHIVPFALWAQNAPPAKVAPAPPGVTLSEPIYPIPIEDRAPMRDLQVQWDEIEIDSQRKLLEIEKNHEKQTQIMDQLKVLAIKFAQKKQINLDLYEIDPKELKFVKRK